MGQRAGKLGRQRDRAVAWRGRGLAGAGWLHAGEDRPLRVSKEGRKEEGTKGAVEDDRRVSHPTSAQCSGRSPSLRGPSVRVSHSCMGRPFLESTDVCSDAARRLPICGDTQGLASVASPDCVRRVGLGSARVTSTRSVETGGRCSTRSGLFCEQDTQPSARPLPRCLLPPNIPASHPLTLPLQ